MFFSLAIASVLLLLYSAASTVIQIVHQAALGRWFGCGLVMGRKLVGRWLDAGWALVGRWLDTGWTPVANWLVGWRTSIPYAGWMLAVDVYLECCCGRWGDAGWTLVGHWSDAGWTLPGRWLELDARSRSCCGVWWGVV